MPAPRMSFSDALRKLGRWATMRWSGYGGLSGTQGAFRYLYPSTRRDWQKEAGDTWRNSCAAGCLAWIAVNFLEPRLRVMRVAGKGSDKEITPHPMLDLIACPNEFEDDEILWNATNTSYFVDGNAYWLKVRGMGGRGRPLELWYVPHFQMFPRWPSDGSQFISHYEYWVPQTGQLYPVRREDVVHFKWGKDLRNDRYGESPYKQMLRLAVGDNEADNYTASLLANFGSTGVVFTNRSPNGALPPEVVESLESQWNRDLTGDGRFDVAVINADLQMHRPAMTVEELALDKVRRVPEARMHAAFLVNAMVTGMNVGDTQRTYQNMGEAIGHAYDSCLRPTQRRMAKVLNRQLLPDFVGDSRSQVCDWDYSKVHALQGDRNARSMRVVQEWSLDMLSLNETRRELGYEPEEDPELGKKRYTELTGGMAPDPAKLGGLPGPGRPKKQSSKDGAAEPASTGSKA